MRSVADHEAVVAALFGPPTSMTVAVPDALGLVTAVDTDAPISLPGFDNSAMDGYAVRAAEVAAATETSPVRLPVAEDIPAGRTDTLILEPGTAHRIMTGAPLPEGADAVVPVESTDASTTIVSITVPVPAGRHIRLAGSDITLGEPALRAGTQLSAPQIGLLAALGFAVIEVYRPLRVVVLSTGSELIAPGRPLRFGQIYESNGPMLTAAANAAGAHARHMHSVVDDTAAFDRRIAEIADDADLIITSGGVSAGAFEVVKEALAGPGPSGDPQVEFVKVAMQPGMPQGCGHIISPAGRAVPIITLPGNPVSSLVSFEVFIRPALREAMGLPPHRRRVSARLASDVRSPDGKRQFLRGVLRGIDAHDDDGAAGVTVDPIGPPSSHHLRYLAEADALIDVPTDVTALAEGDIVEVWVL